MWNEHRNWPQSRNQADSNKLQAVKRRKGRQDGISWKWAFHYSFNRVNTVEWITDQNEKRDVVTGGGRLS
jgi:hypothetical protein